MPFPGSSTASPGADCFSPSSWFSPPRARIILATPPAIRLIIQTYLIFAIGYRSAKAWKLPYLTAAPAGMIGVSNFFEPAVAVTVSLFGLSSGVMLATMVGVLVEVPSMLSLVRIAGTTRSSFPESARAREPVLPQARSRRAEQFPESPANGRSGARCAARPWPPAAPV